MHARLIAIIVFSLAALGLMAGLASQHAEAAQPVAHVRSAPVGTGPRVKIFADVIDFYASPRVVDPGGSALIHWKVGINSDTTLLFNGRPVQPDGNYRTGPIYQPRTYQLSVTAHGQSRVVGTVTVGVAHSVVTGPGAGVVNPPGGATSSAGPDFGGISTTTVRSR